MSTVRIIATADNHLSRYHARMTPARLERRRERLRQAFGEAVSYTVEWGAHLFLHGGDLFDSPSPTNADLAFVAGCLRRLDAAGIAVFAAGGNHDTPSGRTVQGGVAPLSPLASLGGLTYFGAPTLDKREVAAGGATLCIGGLTPAPGHNPIDPLGALTGPEGEDIAIFLTHGALEGHGLGAEEPVLRLRTARALPNLALAVAGHVHAYASERAGGAVLLAPGATEWLTHGETAHPPGFASLLLEDGRVTHLEHIPVEPQPRVTLELVMEEVLGDPHEAALELIRQNSSPEAIVRLRVRGAATREQYTSLKLRRLQELGEEMNFHFDLDATGLHLREEFSRDVVRGVRVSQPQEIAAVAEELLEAEESARERALWTAARDEILGHYE
jgi:DNA repair exonuclease SbcCD nuclease subunit